MTSAMGEKQKLINDNEYQGVYMLKPGSPKYSMSHKSESGRWQAWRTSNGDFLVQPLTFDMQAYGGFITLTSAVFSDTLVRVAKSSGLRADDPCLLNCWFYISQQEQHGVMVEGANKRSLDAARSFILGVSSPGFEAEQYDARFLGLRKKMAEALAKLGEEQRSETTDSLESLLDDEGGDSWNKAGSFTELGLALRREKQYELALLCHSRALELSPDDERVLFNIARTEFEMGKINEAREHLYGILEKNPEFSVARDFLRFLDGGNISL